MDTGVLVAAADRKDNQHRRCADLLESTTEPLATTALVIAEDAYLIERELGSAVEVLLYESIIDGGLRVEDLTIADWRRVAVLVGRYRSLPLGGTDASLVAIAERLGETTIATIDRRHFSVVRPSHCDAFTLLP